MKKDHRHLSITESAECQIEIDVSFTTLMYPRSTIHRNPTSNTHLHANIRPH